MREDFGRRSIFPSNYPLALRNAVLQEHRPLAHSVRATSIYFPYQRELLVSSGDQSSQRFALFSGEVTVYGVKQGCSMTGQIRVFWVEGNRLLRGFFIEGKLQGRYDLVDMSKGTVSQYAFTNETSSSTLIATRRDDSVLSELRVFQGFLQQLDQSLEVRVNGEHLFMSNATQLKNRVGVLLAGMAMVQCGLFADYSLEGLGCKFMQTEVHEGLFQRGLLKEGFKLKHSLELSEQHRKMLAAVRKGALLKNPNFANSWLDRQDLLKLNRALMTLRTIFSSKKTAAFQTSLLRPVRESSPLRGNRNSMSKSQLSLISRYSKQTKEHKAKKMQRTLFQPPKESESQMKKSISFRILEDLRKNGLSIS